MLTSQVRAPVHPHGRGDNAPNAPRCASAIGSPPRAWGQCRRWACARLDHRFTPTGVGTIRVGRFGIPMTTVHPHGRGDNEHYTFDGAILYGSPPRAWGQLLLNSAINPPKRFTPTGVGTMGVRPGISAALAVHPHGRGDNIVLLIRTEARNGSPPRAWGQFVQRRVQRTRARFTPTGVGTILNTL